MLPRSYEYMVKMGFVILKGYNIVGDGTPQALLPILTGKKETELPEARRGFTNSSYVDNFPWIWKDFKNAGYVTQWAEDMQSIGTFQLRMQGFRKQPVDHYMRVFYLEAERYYSRFRRLCLGSISRHKNMMNWLKEFFNIYSSKPKFSFIFHSETSHNYNNPLSLLDNDLLELLKYLKHSGIAENTILLFMSDHGVRVNDLRQYSQGKLEERLPFFSLLMPRSFQEKYPIEMKNLRLNSRKLTTPFDIHETLKHILNFDSSSSSRSFLRGKKIPRGISLLKNIPTNRSCEDAQIEAHWCSCLNWIELNINSSLKFETNMNESPKKLEMKNITFEQSFLNILTQDSDLNSSFYAINSTLKNKSKLISLNYEEYVDIESSFYKYTKSALNSGLKAVEFMNSLIEDDLEMYCHKIYLYSIQRLSKLDINMRLLAFKESKDIHGREALFDDLYENSSQDLVDTGNLEIYIGKSKQIISSNLSNSNESLKSLDENVAISNKYLESETVFQISLTTWPGKATYELSFKYNRYKNLFKFNKNEISRINSYNSTSSCMVSKRPDLRQFCFCKFIE
jgi:hypothetical protein